MHTCLVTGAAGFIGSALAEGLLREGYQVRGLDNLSSGSMETISRLQQYPGFRFIQGDIRHLKDCVDACQNVVGVFHEAALASVPESIEKPLLFHENNATGTLNMLEASRQAGVHRFIFASSCAVYGEAQQMPIKETAPCQPQSPYAIGKWLGEQYCQLYTRQYGLSTVSLRYFNVFGKGQNPLGPYAGVIPLFIKAAQKNDPIIIFGNGEQTRDFISVQSVVNANIAALRADAAISGQVINIGSGNALSVRSLAQQIIAVTKSESEIHYKWVRSGDIVHSVADQHLSKRFLGAYDTVQFSDRLKGILS